MFTCVQSVSDQSLWVENWARWPEMEPKGHPSYAKLFARESDVCWCAFLESEYGKVLFPFIERPLSFEIWTDSSEPAVDLVSPYGYGGPFCWDVNDITKLSTNFWSYFDEWAHDHEVISLFSRLSVFDAQRLPWPESFTKINLNIVRSLGVNMDTMWMDYKQKVRKNVKAAKRAGLSVEFDNSGQYLDDFLEIYYSTMKRNNAAQGYYFSRDFFETIHKELPGSYAYFHVRDPNGCIISTELVLISKNHIYSFLGGTNKESFNLRPNDLLKHEIIEWGTANGYTDFVLGGGYTMEDGIFKHKKAFAPKGEVPHYLACRIFNQDGYENLMQTRLNWEKNHGNEWMTKNDYFPAYRS